MSKKQNIPAIGSAFFALLVAGYATTSYGTTPVVPENLQVPGNQVLALESHATGVQIYTCKARTDDPTRFEWAFKAPEAELFDVAGKKIGKHYAGPTWEFDDGSKVVGAVAAQDIGPDPSAIPWLLLRAKSATGSGVLGRTASIQRIYTVGGKAPAGDCNQQQAGTEARRAYTATYDFYAVGP